MVCGYSDVDIIIPEDQGEFTGAQELLVLPTIDIIVYAHPWKKLGDGIEVVAVLGEILIA